MTSRPTFGDFARAVSHQLEGPAPRSPAGTRRRPGEIAAEIAECTGELRRIVKMMGSYLSDITETAPPGQKPSRPDPWMLAATEAKHAVRNAATSLSAAGHVMQIWRAPTMTSSLSRDFHAAAAAMTAGRDLLHTHFATTATGERRNQSEWAPLITAPPVRNALLTELARWARQAAARAAHLTSREARLRPQLADGQANLIAACHWLTQMAAAIEIAQREQPIRGNAIRKLHAVPANILQPRHLPARAETVSGLCQGTIDTAERVRRAATSAIPEASLSPSANADSFTRSASSATIISHNCATLQRIVATRASQLGNTDLSNRLLASAKLSETAWLAWLATTRAWQNIRTDTEGEIGPAAAEASDLVLWTGRLAYTDPDWTPTIGPGRDRRPPVNLAPHPTDMSTVLTALHQASYTLTTIAAADYTQIRTAARTSRLFIPVVEPDLRHDSGQAFIRAPDDHIETLLGTYRDAGTASIKATAAIAELVAGPGRLPPEAVTSSPAIHQTGVDAKPDVARERRAALILNAGKDQRSGAIESVLRELGVTSGQLLERATALDNATRQLVTEAVDQTAPQRWHAAAIRLRTSADTAQIIEHVLVEHEQQRAHGHYLTEPASGLRNQAEAESLQAEA